MNWCDLLAEVFAEGNEDRVLRSVQTGDVRHDAKGRRTDPAFFSDRDSRAIGSRREFVDPLPAEGRSLLFDDVRGW